MPEDSGRKEKTVDVLGILGVIPLHTTSFLVVITSRSHVTTLLDSPVYMATDFRVFPLSSKADRHHPIDRTLLGLLKSHLYSAPFYFSYGWDLTSSLQRQARVTKQAGEKAVPAWKRADERFFWNHYLSEPLIEATRTAGGPDLSRFILPCIFGFLSVKTATVNGHDFLFGLIARRSRHRAGTRYFSRGVDEEGNVSNFNETEQFVILDPPTSDGGASKGHIQGKVKYSYVQTRGSVPVHWAEVNNLRYKPDLVVMEKEETKDATARHFRNQVDFYGDNYLVNLVNQSGYEKPVKEAYEKAVDALNNDRVHYIYYDFHHECKGMKFEKVWDLVERLQKMGLKGDDWFEYDEGSKGGSIVKEQSHAVRTNCMDCLDRTNVVQGTLGRWVLTYQLRKAGILGEDEWIEKSEKFMYLFRNVWADHADGVSRAYSGTGALKTDFTRTGKRSTEGAIQDGVNSITRYVKNNFFDGPRQDAYDLFTGSWKPEKGVAGTRRSLTLRAMPYILAFSFAMVLAGLILPHHGDEHHYLSLTSYLAIWFTVLTFSLRFILDQGVEFVAYPSLHRDKYDELIKYNGKGWSSGRHGRGPGEKWGGNRKGGRYVGGDMAKVPQ
ncbi:hypothetical protein BCV69DRAFT_280226 [Microstroma glucosiphilum]|uniref:SAC domain-containing protein n=1 Tax=Pseudomicrostroma glucosiphilum TaxID=1684307 RepID=A0A316UCS2_9BASI|nr:hypothetical protein BCV69DRAFT_280226 [Pseudomicrostroma glucosiphilum]PWN22634.1 hypothetical protein BCV69DRAFT_280226 [Pseudomicrostroma glucosiphilum]